jgi:hypothetical protein
VCLNADPAAEAIEELFRNELLRHLTKLAEKARVSSEQATAPPAPEEGCSLYCPRCRAQFEKDTEACSDCGGVPVRSIAGASAEPRAPTPPAAP